MSAVPQELDRVVPHADAAVFRQVEDRVLWLATAAVHHANRVRPNPSGMKVGGHQASSASIATIMTHLWMRHLRAEDRVSVKPHASPVLHALNALTGSLDPAYLPRLRELGGLQSYPSRSKDPDPVDYSTGSVGIGATAPVWGALARRYVAGLDPQPSSRVIGRQYSLVGDAELDEGAVWEALLDEHVPYLGEVVWIVDLNRQSLDRVANRMMTSRFEGMFTAAGWQVITVKWGTELERLFARPGGDALRARLEEMSNPEYQRMLRRDPAGVRAQLVDEGYSLSGRVRDALTGLSDDEVAAAVRDLGGHCPDALDAAYAAIDDTRPTVILAYTVKGHRLATEGHPQNHSSLLTGEQLAALAARLGASMDEPWRLLDADSDAGRLCAEVGRRLRREPMPSTELDPVPVDFGRIPKGTANTQAALGRVLMDLTRAAPALARRVVTVSPDVTSSTNLAGWVNKVGVWSGADESAPNWFADDPETLLQWDESLHGQHVELGIAEVNLVSVLGELGATWSRWGQPLLPIGVLYDPFVNRALEPWTYGIYAGGQSLLVGTPSGVTLSAEGGAHQSVTTPSLGLEQPGLVTYEPAFAVDAEWTILASLGRLGRTDGTSAYLRLSTRPVDQSLAQVPQDAVGRQRRREHVVAGAYRLRAAARPDVTIAAMGAVVPEALAAASALEEAGLAAEVVCVTSPGLIFQSYQARHGRPVTQFAAPWILDQVFPAERAAPLVTVLDGHPHTLAFLASINRVRASHLGVTTFGQSGSLEDVYRLHGIDAGSIARACLDLIQ